MNFIDKKNYLKKFNPSIFEVLFIHYFLLKLFLNLQLFFSESSFDKSQSHLFIMLNGIYLIVQLGFNNFHMNLVMLNV